MMQFTIDSDDEVPPEPVSEDDNELFDTGKGKGSKSSKGKKRRFRFDDGKNLPSSSDDDSSDSEQQDEDDEALDTKRPAAPDAVKAMPHTLERAQRAETKLAKKSKQQQQEEDENGLAPTGMDAETEAAFFDSVVEEQSSTGRNIELFTQLNLSRPLLRGIEASGYVNPTPVQAKVIPVALSGRDICASAVTGSGKTAAFVLPFLERLLFRPKDVAATRVLVVSPTRELAVQTYEVLQKLGQFTDVTSVLICGGKRDVKSQEAALRQRPDVVICTPGRFIDHLRNSHSVDIDDLDVLVLDEVDRLLDLGFREEVEQLIKYCPETRQTLLFSATMTSGVEELSKLSLRKPVRIKTGPNISNAVAPRLVQEFVRVRKEDEREAGLVSLVVRNFNKRVIVFFETKREAHRFYIILKLMKIKVSELHGDLPQAVRYNSLQDFREGRVDVLVATDVAARGIDIPLVQAVINSEMPRVASTYVHRVGRTARAGCGGRAITLVSDSRRKVMKEVLKGEAVLKSTDGKEQDEANSGVLSRSIPSAVISHYVSLVAGMEQQIAELMEEERLNMRALAAERDVERAENMLLHEDEIKSRPARTWYQSEHAKQELKEAVRQKSKFETEIAKVGFVAATAAEKAKELALADDYRVKEEEKQQNKLHKMSRKKRRRMEAMKEMLEETDGITSASIKKVKSEAREKEHAKTFKPAGGLSMGQNSKPGSAAGGKVRRPVFAVGGLDADLHDWIGGAKIEKASKKRKVEKEFTEFDASKRLRKGGKLGNKSFKSKGKFKRR